MSDLLESEVKKFERDGDSLLLSAVKNVDGTFVVDSLVVTKFIDSAQSICDHLNSPEQEKIGKRIALEMKVKKAIPILLLFTAVCVAGIIVKFNKRGLKQDQKETKYIRT